MKFRNTSRMVKVRTIELCALLTCFFFQAAVRANHDPLFIEVSVPSGVELPPQAMENLARVVEINPHLLQGPSFELNLFPGKALEAGLDRFEDNGNGDFVWTGHIDGEPLSRVTFASRQGVIAGVIDRALTDGNELYEVTVLPNGKYLLTRIDESTLPMVAPGVEAPL